MMHSTIKTNWVWAIALLLPATPIKAHEYWLDPIDSSIEVGNSALVDVRNGQHFSGAAFPYDDSRFQSVTINNTDGQQQYSGRLGDYPAIHLKLNTLGIHSIHVNTYPTSLTYDSWEKFTSFLDYHGFTDVEQRHLERDLPKQSVTESYTRSAKTLVHAIDPQETQVSKTLTSKESQAALAPTDNLFELVLLENPLRDVSAVRAELRYDGNPLVGRQVELFWKGTQSVRLTTITDEMGIATFKLLGDGEYMLNAVHLTEPKSSDVHWQSHWASFTFER